MEYTLSFAYKIECFHLWTESLLHKSWDHLIVSDSFQMTLPIFHEHHNFSSIPIFWVEKEIFSTIRMLSTKILGIIKLLFCVEKEPLGCVEIKLLAENPKIRCKYIWIRDSDISPCWIWCSFVWKLYTFPHYPQT